LNCTIILASALRIHDDMATVLQPSRHSLSGYHRPNAHVLIFVGPNSVPYMKRLIALNLWQD
jgi:hypothetical protein